MVVNTCGFIERAREESYAAIHEMLELKRRGDIRGVIVSGCLAEREKERLLETLPEIDHLVGVFGREDGDQSGRPADRRTGRAADGVSARPVDAAGTTAGGCGSRRGISRF